VGVEERTDNRMSDNRNERRRSNGRRLEGRGLVAQVARDVVGMVLAQAFIVVRSAGFKLQVNKNDGVPRMGMVADAGPKVIVDVVGGYVRKSWASE
jgi:hypothetical protein